MLRLVLTMLGGAIVAGAATFWAVSTFGARSGARPSTSVTAGDATSSALLETQAPAAAAAAAAAVPVAARLESARALGDAAACGAALQRSNALPASEARALELEALVTRCAELDARRTVALIADLGLGRRMLVRAFQAWAERDADAALAAVGTLAAAADQRSAAAGLLEVLGGDDAAIERIAAAAPAADATSLRVAAFMLRAQRDPLDALNAALASPDGTARRLALPEIAALWATQDPVGALRAAAGIGEPAELTAFEAGVLRQWAQSDVGGFLAYVETNFAPGSSASTLSFMGALGLAAAVDVDRVLGLADRLDGTRAQGVRLAAFRTLAFSDMDAALARYGALPPAARESTPLSIAAAIASAYARADPDAALAWASSLDPPSPGAVSAVVSAVADVDPVWALDLALDSDSATVRAAALTIGMSAASSGDAATVARVLARLEGSGASRTTVLSTWARRDPEAALEWIKTHPLARTEATLVVRRLAEAFASRDAAEAQDMTDTLPESLRATWRVALTSARVQSNPSALSGLFAGTGRELAPDEAQAVLQAARANPAAALAQLESADEPLRTRILAATLRDYTRTNPVEASEWARGVRDPALRAQAMRGVAVGWAQNDFPAARRWVFGLTDAAARDAGLGALLFNAALDDVLDDALLAEFSSETARVDELKRALPLIARTDLEQARELLDRYVTDSDERRSVELEIDRARTLMPLGARPAPLPPPSR